MGEAVMDGLRETHPGLQLAFDLAHRAKPKRKCANAGRKPKKARQELSPMQGLMPQVFVHGREDE